MCISVFLGLEGRGATRDAACVFILGHGRGTDKASGNKINRYFKADL
jgi:hypothetical protein